METRGTHFQEDTEGGNFDFHNFKNFQHFQQMNLFYTFRLLFPFYILCRFYAQLLADKCLCQMEDVKYGNFIEKEELVVTR